MARHFVAFGALLVGIAPQIAKADAYTFDQMYVFGDSLSDTGNIDNRTFGFFLTPPKYTQARFTDGADTKPAAQDKKYVAGGGYNVIWHEQLAKLAGIPAASASLIDGNKQNYAFGGATTGNGTTDVYRSADGKQVIKADNMGKQVTDFLALGKTPAKALYVLWGGGNDLRNVFFQSYSDKMNDLTTLKSADVVNAAKTAVKNIAAEITSLINAKGGGPTQFLWPDLPPIDLTPRFLPIDNMKLGDGTTIGADLMQAVKDFKTDEEAQITALQKQFAAKKVKIAELDVYTAFNNIIANPKKYGYSNVKDPAQMLKPDANPDGYLFWDEFHPTSHAHYDIAQLADKALMDAGMCPTPEPSSFVLAGLGGAGVIICAWRRRKVVRKLGVGMGALSDQAA
jgi:outer membrane lipase/esterase